MHKRTLVVSAVLCAVLAAAAWAADVTGTWVGDLTTPDGNTFTLTYSLKQDGGKLTGSVAHPNGDPLEIHDGKVEGDKLSFNVSAEMNGGSMKFLCTGTVKGDEIALSTKTETGEDFGGTITIKRQK
ncbi:MAG: hypothetical protein LAP87_12245 [Acidobacteriia bacterium]|nr:hypothetical protein [Terriglobia bacterium]